MRRGHLHTLACLAFMAFWISPHAHVAHAQTPAVAPARATLIRQILTLTRAAELTVTTMEAAIPAQRAANPRVPKEFWEEFAARARKEAPRFLDMLIPVYDAQFTTPQLEELVAFYQSPLGRHLVEVQPLLAVQSMQAGQQWGAQLGAQIAEDLARRGIEMPRP